MLFVGNRKGYVAVRQGSVVKLTILSFLKWKEARGFGKPHQPSSENTRKARWKSHMQAISSQHTVFYSMS